MGEWNEEPSVFEVASEAQELAIRVERLVGWVKTLIFFSILLPAFLFWARVQLTPKMQALCFSVSGMFLVFPYYFLRRAKHQLYELRLQLNRLYLHHKSKASETCGSMDPHFTRARN